MKKLLITIATIWLVLGLNYGASAWTYVPDYGDTGWQTFTYTAASGGFTGTAGFVVSNALDNGAYSELLLDNLKGGGVTNLGFESGLSGYTLLTDSLGYSFANVSPWEQAAKGNTYYPTQGEYLAVLQGLYIESLYGVATSHFSNASGQSGTIGSILERAIILNPGAKFSFDWAFLAGDMSPWNDFARFYLKDQSGAIVFCEGLAQIGSAPAAPIPASVLLLGTGLLSLLGLARKAKGRWGRGEEAYPDHVDG
jgi:hypothetical protein